MSNTEASRCSTPALGWTTLSDSTHRFVSSPTSGIASCCTPLGGLENLPTLITNSKPIGIITDPLVIQTTERYHRQWKWQLQLQAVSTPLLVVFGSHSIQQFGYLHIMDLVSAPGWLLTVKMCNRSQCMCAMDYQIIRYAMQCVAKRLVEAPYWLTLKIYWNTTLQQNTIWSIAIMACPQEILKVVCWSNSPPCILHTQTGTRFEYKSKNFNPI